MKTEYNKTTVMPYRNIKRFSQVNKHCANQQWCMKLFCIYYWSNKGLLNVSTNDLFYSHLIHS